MSAFYNKLAQTSKTLIDKFGYEVILERSVGGQTNPVTGEQYLSIDKSVKTKGILLDYKTEEIDGTKILATDKKLAIDASKKPEYTDKPKANKEYLGSIINIKEVSPAGVPIVYFLQMRK